MKYIRRPDAKKAGGVTTRAVVWIEIIAEMVQKIKDLVTTRAVVWIEIPKEKGCHPS